MLSIQDPSAASAGLSRVSSPSAGERLTSLCPPFVGNSGPEGTRLHGGGYQTEASHLMRGTAGAALNACINDHGARAISAERIVAFCLGKVAVETCRRSEDPRCGDMLHRVMESAPAAQGWEAIIERTEVRRELEQRFRESDGFWAVMGHIEPPLRALAASPLQKPSGGHTVDSLMQVYDGAQASAQQAFQEAVAEQTAVLNSQAKEVVRTAYELEPEKLDAQGLGEINHWLDRNYPVDAALPLLSRILRTVLDDLAFALNHPQQRLHVTPR